MDSANMFGVSYGRFAATMDKGECYWDAVDDPGKVIVTLKQPGSVRQKRISGDTTKRALLQNTVLRRP